MKPFCHFGLSFGIVSSHVLASKESKKVFYLTFLTSQILFEENVYFFKEWNQQQPLSYLLPTAEISLGAFGALVHMKQCRVCALTSAL